MYCRQSVAQVQRTNNRPNEPDDQTDIVDLKKSQQIDMTDQSCPDSFENELEEQYYEPRQSRYIYSSVVIPQVNPPNERHRDYYTSYSRMWYDQQNRFVDESSGQQAPSQYIYVKQCPKRKKFGFNDLPKKLQQQFPNGVQINGVYNHPTYGTVYDLGPGSMVDAPAVFYDSSGRVVFHNGLVPGWTPNPSKKQIDQYSNWFNTIKRIA